MVVSCYPVIKPFVAAARTVHRVVRHRIVAAHQPTVHAAHPPPHGVGLHGTSHGGATHGATAPHLPAQAAVPKAGAAGHAAPVSIKCVAVPGPLPAGPGAVPGATKAAGAYPQFGGAFPGGGRLGSVPPGGAPGFGGVAAGAPGGIAAGGLGILSGSKATLAAGVLLAVVSGAGLGAGAVYLEQTGAFNSLIGSPAPTVPIVISTTLPTLAGMPDQGANLPVNPVVPSGMGGPGGPGQPLLPDTLPPELTVPAQVPPLADTAPGPPQAVSQPGPDQQPSRPGDTPPEVLSPDTAPSPGTTAPTPVPEPASLLVFLLGGLGGLLVRHLRRT